MSTRQHNVPVPSVQDCHANEGHRGTGLRDESPPEHEVDDLDELFERDADAEFVRRCERKDAVTSALVALWPQLMAVVNGNLPDGAVRYKVVDGLYHTVLEAVQAA